LITDTHAHLYYPEILSGIDEILSRAKDAGVERIIVPAVDIETSLTVLKLSEKYDMIYAALGIHPCDVSKSELSALDELEKLLHHEKVVAIGETGLDYYWDTTHIEKQKIFFKLQIELAKSYHLPIVIHTRSSTDDAIEIIKQMYDEKLKGQFHCFNGDSKQLNEVLALDNFYISYCGNITYKNYKETDIVKATPTERLLSETDSPFLPPVPYRGKKNEPSYIIHTIDKLSEIHQTDKNLLQSTINTNANKLFFRIPDVKVTH